MKATAISMADIQNYVCVICICCDVFVVCACVNAVEHIAVIAGVLLSFLLLFVNSHVVEACVRVCCNRIPSQNRNLLCQKDHNKANAVPSAWAMFFGGEEAAEKGNRIGNANAKSKKKTQSRPKTKLGIVLNAFHCFRCRLLSSMLLSFVWRTRAPLIRIIIRTHAKTHTIRATVQRRHNEKRLPNNVLTVPDPPEPKMCCLHAQKMHCLVYSMWANGRGDRYYCYYNTWNAITFNSSQAYMNQ